MNIKKRKRLGEKEIEVISRLSYEKKRVVTKEDLNALFKFDNIERNKIVYQLKKKGIFSTIKRGIYVFSPLEYGEGGATINEMLIPTILSAKQLLYWLFHDVQLLQFDGSAFSGGVYLEYFIATEKKENMRYYI